jgi:hypothetical protein
MPKIEKSILQIGFMLDRLSKKSKAKPTELGPYLEGDILFQGNPLAAPRSGIIGDHYRWPNGRIIFQFSHSYSNNFKFLLKSQWFTYCLP